MQNYIISCCATVDTSREWADEYEIECLPLHFGVGEQSYTDDFWTAITPAEMYRRMLDGEEPNARHATEEEYAEYFRKFLLDGKDVLHVSLSSGISEAFHSAEAAAQMLQKEFPDRKLMVVDSMGASSGYGLLMAKLSDLRKEGKSITEAAVFAMENRLKVHHWFYTTDLTFFIKGGRITKAAGFVGKLLDICPVMNVDYKGRLVPRDRVRSKEKAAQQTVEKMKEYAENGTDYDGLCYISHSDCEQDALYLKNLVEETFPKLAGKIRIFPIGAVIGTHTGPGTVALFFAGGMRVE